TLEPRNLFMSTAGSTVQYQDKEAKNNETETKVSKKKTVAKNYSRHKAVAQRFPKEPYLGMEVQVLKKVSDRLVPVDPKRTIFREGDVFKVQVLYNSPGVVEFYNINPAGETIFLGRWIVEKPFVGTLIPAEGWFKFEGKEKGKDKLVVQFTPCIPNDSKVVQEVNSAYSRSIALVEEDQVKLANFSADVPVCSTDFKEKAITQEDIKYANSRSIIVMEETYTKKAYYFVPQSAYKQEGKPIVSVIEFNYK
ncbi:MAG: hypothetical protein ACP5P0_04610, partial [Hydrogenobacter sp.]